jgi:hypothetical protein
MPDKTVLDFSEITTQVLEDDILYDIRGTGVGRDRKIKAEKLIGNVITQDTTGSIDLSSYYHDLVIVANPASADITITLSNALQNGRKLYVINKSSSYNVLLAGTFGTTLFSKKTIILVSDGTTLYEPGSRRLNIKYVTGADYTILDNDGFDVIDVDTQTGVDRTITLPTLADNEGRRIIITRNNYLPNREVIIDGEGSETIDGKTTINLSRQYSIIEIVATTNEWKIVSINSQWFDTGWINRSDWTTVHLGNAEVDYDNISGSFTVGATVTGGTSGTTGRIVRDNGATLILEDVTNGGIFTNNEQLTDDATGVTADVNEPSGDNKNQDSNLSHFFDSNLSDMEYRLFISTDGTEANSIEVWGANWALTGSGDRGYNAFQIDIDSLQIQTGQNGIHYINSSGIGDIVDTEDWYYKIKYRKREVI